MATAPAAYSFSLCPLEEAQGVLSRSETRLWLSPAEEAALGSLRPRKRRCDRLSGRIAAKRALGRRLSEDFSLALEPRAIEVLNEISGKPYCRLLPEGCAGETDPASLSPKLSFSISHSTRGGLCAVARNSRPIGTDWETIAPRGEKMLALYAHEEERSQELASSAEAQTRLWTLKEAVLKFLGLGLALDPRDVRFTGGRGGPPELHGSARRRWEELGSPRIALEHFVFGDSLIAVAFSGE